MVIIQLSAGVINGVYQAIVYVKRDNKTPYRVYKLTRSSAIRIRKLKGIRLYEN